VDQNLNTAIIERLERVVDTLQENSIQMGKLLAVHNEKLDKQDRVDEILFEKLDRLSEQVKTETNIIKKGCERDIRLIDDRLRVLEKKMWSIAGAFAVVSFLLSPIGQRIVKPVLTGDQQSSIMLREVSLSDESDRFKIHRSHLG
jgi:hypothetical protein|tara:strand:+ start:771 stop:1205 length:435 start_codon:yes stop_codon:yes gene_type:complete